MGGGSKVQCSRESRHGFVSRGRLKSERDSVRPEERVSGDAFACMRGLGDGDPILVVEGCYERVHGRRLACVHGREQARHRRD